MEELYKDFEELSLEFYRRGNLYGLEKYWYVSLNPVSVTPYCFKSHYYTVKSKSLCLNESRAFHHYRGSKEALRKDPELDKLLKEEYRSLEDFRAKERATGAPQ